MIDRLRPFALTTILALYAIGIGACASNSYVNTVDDSHARPTSVPALTPGQIMAAFQTGSQKICPQVGCNSQTVSNHVTIINGPLDMGHLAETDEDDQTIVTSNIPLSLLPSLAEHEIVLQSAIKRSADELGPGITCFSVACEYPNMPDSQQGINFISVEVFSTSINQALNPSYRDDTFGPAASKFLSLMANLQISPSMLINVNRNSNPLSIAQLLAQHNGISLKTKQDNFAAVRAFQLITGALYINAPDTYLNLTVNPLNPVPQQALSRFAQFYQALEKK